MKVRYNRIFKQWEASTDDGYTAVWADTKEAAIKKLLGDGADDSEICIYGRTLEERLQMCKVCSAACKSRIDTPDPCVGCNNVKGCVTCVDGDQWAHIEEDV
jgi:hypothetical protein